MLPGNARKCSPRSTLPWRPIDRRWKRRRKRQPKSLSRGHRHSSRRNMMRRRPRKRQRGKLPRQRPNLFRRICKIRGKKHLNKRIRTKSKSKNNRRFWVHSIRLGLSQEKRNWLPRKKLECKRQLLMDRRLLNSVKSACIKWRRDALSVKTRLTSWAPLLPHQKARTSSTFPRTMTIKDGSPSLNDSTSSNSRTPKRALKYGFTKHSMCSACVELSWNSGVSFARTTSVTTSAIGNTVWLRTISFYLRLLLSRSSLMTSLTSSLRQQIPSPPLATSSPTIPLPSTS